MFKNKINTLFQVAGLAIFCVMAAASASSQDASSSGSIDMRGAAVGYNGYIIIGKASSESEAKQLAANKGYSAYIFDTVNGNVFAK